MADDKPIIIIKKKGGHGGHHGGAWKVAYADFVTAMMAFFMVMWLVNTADTQTKKNIASYFRRPGLFESGSGTPLLIGEAGILNDAYVPPHPQETKKTGGKSQDAELPKHTGTDELKDKKKQVTLRGEEGKQGGLKDAKGKVGMQKDNTTAQGELSDKKSTADIKAADAEKLLAEKAAEQIRQQIATSKDLQELIGIVDVKVEADGLNIEIMDTAKSSMFASGSARILPDAQKAFDKIGSIIKGLPYSIDIVGHTDAKPFSSRQGGYGNWELSSDRANAARRLLESEGIESKRITSVVGRADKDLKFPEDPQAPSNRRITLKMRFKINQNVNFEQNPNLVENPELLTQATPETQPSVDEKTPETVHELTPAGKKPAANEKYVPKSVVKAKERDDLVKLPDADAPTAPAGKELDKLFGGNPVLGPNDPFSSF
ncbi:MAG: OmpA family protein [Deltaproteobacteria bacterium]|nr:OmpA family protein [Deltaproteobacteria bacterium]